MYQNACPVNQRLLRGTAAHGLCSACSHCWASWACTRGELTGSRGDRTRPFSLLRFAMEVQGLPSSRMNGPSEDLRCPKDATHDGFSAHMPPSSYEISSQTLTSPLAEITELRAHLGLSRAFKDLRNRVEQAESSELPEETSILDKQQRRAWFVGLAVDRYISHIRSFARTS